MTHASTPQGAHDSRTDSSVVDSLLHPQAVLIRRLLTRSRRCEVGNLILVDDAGNIMLALRAGLAVRSVFHSKDAAVRPNMQEQLPRSVLNYEVARRTCKKLFGNDRVSRVFAIAEAPPARSLDGLLPVRRDIVVLDSLAISGNIGAIIRTGSAMGVGAIVILSAESGDIFDRRVIRASRGHVFDLPVVATTAHELVEFCTRQQVLLAVTQPRGGTPVSAISSLSRPLAIVYGGEKHGPSPALIEAAALRVEIPMTAAVESLNVAAAAAITLHCRYGFNAARSGNRRDRPD